LRRGQVREQLAFGVPLAVYRTERGEVRALQAVCAHMGANLGRGRVVGDRLQCPLHHLEYGPGGGCVHIPGEPDIPARARQMALPCREQYGLVYAFLGERPFFDLPRFDDDEPEIYSRAHVMDFETPYQVLAANSFDAQHFSTVHHRPLLEAPQLDSYAPEHLAIHFRARVEGHAPHELRAVGIHTVRLSAHCWGGSLILAYNARTTSYIMFNVLPLDEHRTRVFILTVLSRRGWPRWPRPARRLALAVAHRLTIAFLKPDIEVMRQLKFRLGVLLPEADRCYIEWVRYWKRLPRWAVGADGREPEPARVSELA
jgi:phenylpropionate dioxygenase-like ring-hydroxylating dioxygenase large terminal subunit